MFTPEEKAIMWRARYADDALSSAKDDVIKVIYANHETPVAPNEAAEKMQAAIETLLAAKKERDIAMTAYMGIMP